MPSHPSRIFVRDLSYFRDRAKGLVAVVADGLPNALAQVRRWHPVHQDASDAAIVEAIIGLSRAMGLSTIAEGVETAEQATALRVLHCGEFQGYFFARPAPAADTEKLFGHRLGRH